jgi:hypothetical protein
MKSWIALTKLLLVPMDLFCVAYIPSTTRADRIKIAVHAGVEERPPAPFC